MTLTVTTLGTIPLATHNVRKIRWMGHWRLGWDTYGYECIVMSVALLTATL